MLGLKGDAHPTCNCEEVMLQSTVSELQHCFILPQPHEAGAGQGAPSIAPGQGSSAAFIPKGLLPSPCLLLFRIEKLLTAVNGRVTIWWVSVCSKTTLGAQSEVYQQSLFFALARQFFKVTQNIHQNKIEICNLQSTVLIRNQVTIRLDPFQASF